MGTPKSQVKEIGIEVYGNDKWDMLSFCWAIAQVGTNFHPRVLGPYITSYREGKGIPIKLKATLLVLIWITIPLSAIFLVQQLYLRLALLAIPMVVSTIIWRLPTLRQASREDGNNDNA